ncbi:CBS domain-containing protein [Capnocytophaga sp. oral taxon 324]|uniref:CBS domain-containing protein n=1 Tax=Capnocytophaga sp. oral taxon 324 TaxID=712211 RepID=UPI0002A43962|nr:CBS domain-containing protein [Capnocytophaga sp. oral taxon 324]EKY17700.1 CBS domain protein [Capnocytophaga sp. oral taxon 324 str. F0483]
MTTHFLHIDPSTSIEEVNLLFEAHLLSALPVCENNSFIGVLRKEAVDEDDKEAIVADYQYALERFFVPLTATWDTVIEAFASYHTDMLPVINEDQQFIGYYYLGDFIQQLTKTPFIQEAGRVLILEKDALSYSFAEISRIVEENGGTLLGLYLSNRTEDNVHITLKLISNRLSDILQDFRRYGYGILTEKDDDHYRQELKDIADYFEKYLDLGNR